MSNIKLFESTGIRSVWNEVDSKWYFSVADVVQALTDSTDVRGYIKKMRKRESELNANWGTLCPPLGMAYSRCSLQSKHFTRGFLICAPGLTIKDRLRVLQPNDPDSYYTSTTTKSNAECLFLVSAAARVVNIPAWVVSLLLISPTRICSKIDHSTARWASGNLVLRPKRATSRYASLVSNCQASTTCSHSVSKKCRLNLCPPTAFDAPLICSRTDSRLASVIAPQCALKRRIPMAQGGGTPGNRL